MAACLGLAACVAWRAGDEGRLREARARFDREVAPLPPPGPLRPEAAKAREQALWRSLGGARQIAPAARMTAERQRSLFARPPAGWTLEEAAEASRLVAAGGEALEAAHRAAETDAGAIEPEVEEAPPPDDPMPVLSQALAQSTLLLAEMALGVREHAPEKVMGALRALAGEAAAFQRGPAALDQLVGVGLERRLLLGVAWALQEPLLGPVDLEALQRALPRQEPARAIRRMLAAEAALLLQSWDSGPAPGPFPERSVVEVLDGYRRFALAVERPFPEAQRSLAALPFWDPAPGRRPRRLPNAILSLVLPNFTNTVWRLQANGASHQLAELAIALRLSAIRNGSFPAALAQPAFAAGPDPLSGQPPVYVLESGGAALLSNPAAASSFRAALGNTPSAPPPFEWRLVPPPRLAETGMLALPAAALRHRSRSYC